MTCAKCGGKDISTAYHRDKWACLWDQRDDDNRDREHLHFHCRGCSYSWTGPTKDHVHMKVTR